MHLVCLSLPLGFAGSFFLTQSTLMQRCFAEGVEFNQVPFDDYIAPFRTNLNFALATDDIIFWEGRPAAGEA